MRFRISGPIPAPAPYPTSPLAAWVAALTLACAATAAKADANPPAAAPPTGIPTPSIATSLPLLADPAGLRAVLAKRGVTFGLNYIGEVLGNVAGGERRGAIADGRLEIVLDADLNKLIGWQDGALHLNAYETHGTDGLTRGYIGNLMTVSNIEALSAMHLYEAWFEQKFAAGKVALRMGQLGADTEFLTSTYAGLFIGSTMGWPAITGVDLPSGGGPAYPLATPGARLKVQPTDSLSFLLGVYDGYPAGTAAGNPQKLDRYGLNFRVTDPPFVIGEVQYQYNLAPDLPGTAKFGAWHHFGDFSDLRFDTAGLSLANPLSTGMARIYDGDQGIYGVVDQLIYHAPEADAGNGIGVFVRAAAAPPNRSLIDYYADTGVDFSGMIAGRPNNSFGLSIAYAHISNRAGALDADTDFYSGTAAPIRDYEAALEFTYQAQIVSGWTIQPDAQLIFHPGGNIANPNVPGGTTPIRNAAVIGIRTTINY